MRKFLDVSESLRPLNCSIIMIMITIIIAIVTIILFFSLPLISRQPSFYLLTFHSFNDYPFIDFIPLFCSIYFFKRHYIHYLTCDLDFILSYFTEFIIWLRRTLHHSLVRILVYFMGYFYSLLESYLYAFGGFLVMSTSTFPM